MNDVMIIWIILCTALIFIGGYFTYEILKEVKENKKFLKNCPGCGLSEDYLEGPYPNTRDNTNWTIQCGNPGCGFTVESFIDTEHGLIDPDDIKQDVIKRWNRRA